MNNEKHNAKQAAQRIRRASRMKAMRSQGKTVQQIADKYGISTARVHYLIASVK